MKKRSILSLLAGVLLSTALAQPTPHWQQQGSATQLMVDNRPYLILGGELGNSSASSLQDIDRIFPKLKRTGLNTVLVPAYWDLIEAEEGTFDFSLVDHAITQARANDLRIVFLWFGAWKNSMSCYAPLWFKQDYKKYPRVRTQTGKPLEIASPFSDNVFQADSKAFKAFMRHLADTDRPQHTVIMVQVENEIGMLESARDYSEEANRLFQSAIPEELADYLVKNKKTLHPWLAEKWQKAGGKTEGNWQKVFGTDLYTDEIFMAWHYASYVERMIQCGREAYNLPMYVNAAMRQDRWLISSISGIVPLRALTCWLPTSTTKGLPAGPHNISCTTTRFLYLKSVWSLMMVCVPFMYSASTTASVSARSP